MIRDAEIRRDARAAGVEPRIIELDYALGWALRGIARHPEPERPFDEVWDQVASYVGRIASGMRGACVPESS